jgi:hypothetical protein
VRAVYQPATEAKAADIEAVALPLEKGDIDVTALTLVWVPVA